MQQVNVTSSSKHKLKLTLSDDQRGEEEKVAHQLGSELVKETAGHSTVQRSATIPHHIHQSDCQRIPCLIRVQNLSENTNKL